MNRRAFAIAMAGSGMAAPVLASTSATPVASPVPTNVAIGVGGGGAVTNGMSVANLTVAAWRDLSGATGGSLRVSQPPKDGVPIEIAAYEIVGVESISERDPLMTRLTGWGTLNGTGDYPFALDLHDTASGTDDDKIVSMVFGRDALPLFQDGPIKQCECLGLGFTMRGPLTSGGIIIQRMEQ